MLDDANRVKRRIQNVMPRASARPRFADFMKSRRRMIGAADDLEPVFAPSPLRQASATPFFERLWWERARGLRPSPRPLRESQNVELQGRIYAPA